MAKVKLPDGTIIEVPDKPSAQELQQLQGLLAKPAATPADGLAAASKFGKPTFLGEAAKVADVTLRGGLLGLPGMIGDVGAWVQGKTAGLRAKYPSLNALQIPFQEMTAMRGKVAPSEALYDVTGGPLSQPETATGKVIGNVGASVVGSVAGGGPFALGKRAAIGLGAGLGAEAGGALTDQGLAGRLLGGLAGGMGTGILTAAKTNRERLAREALRDVKPADLDTAIANMQQAEKAGIPINLSQGMQEGSNVDAYINTLANDPHGKRVIEQLRRQPGQLTLEAEHQLRDLPGTIRAPHVLANNMQESATEVIKQGREAAQKAWTALAPVGAAIPERGMSTFDKQLAAMAAAAPNRTSVGLINAVREAIKNPEVAPPQGPQILGAGGLPLRPPVQAPKYLTDALQVKGAVDDVLNYYGPIKLNTPKLKGNELRVAQEIRQIFSKPGGLLETHTPDLVAANRAYETAMESVDVLKKSVVGRLAGRAGATATTEAPTAQLFRVFDAGTVPGSPSSEILDLESALRKAGRQEDFQDAATSWVATKLSNAMSSADNRLPEKFAERLRDVFGDPRLPDAKSRGMQDVLTALARSQDQPDAVYVEGVPKFLELISNAARRPANPSGTSRAAIIEQAEAGLGRRIGHFSLMTALRQPALAWARFMRADALGEMDKLMTSSEGVEMLRVLAKEPVNSHASITAVSTFLGTAVGTAAAEQTEQMNTAIPRRLSQPNTRE